MSYVSYTGYMSYMSLKGEKCSRSYGHAKILFHLAQILLISRRA